MRVDRDAADDDDDAFPVVGDIVRIRFGVETGEGEVLQDAADAESVTFEVGASDVMGNPLFKAFDEAVDASSGRELDCERERWGVRSESVVQRAGGSRRDWTTARRVGG